MSALDRVLVVGEDPGPSGDPDCPLLWVPRASAGGRLADLIGEGHHRVARVNVLRGHPGRTWPAERAREAGSAIVRASGGRLVVAMGRRAAAALGLPEDLPWYSWRRLRACVASHLEVAVHPHPSGRSRHWNGPASAAEARAFWRLVAALDGDPVGLWHADVEASTLGGLEERIEPMRRAAAWRARPAWDAEGQVWRAQVRARLPTDVELEAARGLRYGARSREDRESILRALGLAGGVCERLSEEVAPYEWRLCEHWRRSVGLHIPCGCAS